MCCQTPEFVLYVECVCVGQIREMDGVQTSNTFSYSGLLLGNCMQDSSEGIAAVNHLHVIKKGIDTAAPFPVLYCAMTCNDLSSAYSYFS